jgi:hypothetical protein
MKIEVGKFYRTRDGRKARIYAVDGREGSNIHGAVLNEIGWITSTWAITGQWIAAESDRDLISEWIDKPEVDWSVMPKWAEWVAMDEDGKWIWFLGEPRKGAANWCCYGVYGEIPHTYAPKWDGDWKDSLVRRTE